MKLKICFSKLFTRSLFVPVIVMMLDLSSVTAQSFVKVGLGIPTGDFNEGSLLESMGNDRFNAAAVGLSAGYIRRWQTGADGGVFLSVDVFYNTLDRSYRDELKDFLADNYASWDVVFPKYINIPVGVGYSHAVSLNDSELYLNAGINFHLLKLTPFETRIEDVYEQDSEVTYTWTYNIGFMLSVLYRINEKYYVFADYFPLGTSKVKARVNRVVFDENHQEVYKDAFSDYFNQPVEFFRVGVAIGL